METYVKELMLEQSKQGVEVAALVHREDPSLRTTQEKYCEDGVSLHLVRVGRWGVFSFAPISPAFPLALHRMLKDFGPDLIHLHVPNVSVFWCLLLPRLRAVPWVIQWQSDVVPSIHSRMLRLFWRGYSYFESQLLRRADCVIVSSPPYLETSETLKRWRSKCTVIPLAVRDKVPPPAQPAASSSAEFRVLSVGRLTYYKGFVHLIRAIGSTVQCQLTLVGHGDERTAIEHEVATLGISDRVHLIGSCTDEELDSLYNSHDVFCLPSIERTESFGLVLLEAMHSNLPCIATKVPGSGMSWILRDGDAGVLVPPTDSDSLAAALDDLAMNRDKLLTLRGSATAQLKTLFGLTGTTKKILKVYRSLLTSPDLSAKR